MLSNVVKSASESKKRENKKNSKKKKTLKIQFNSSMNIMMNNLIKKMKALVLQISVMLENVAN